MATNLEFKARCQALHRVYPRLATLNARHRETLQQIDTYFYVPQNRATSLSEQGKPRLKLRQTDKIEEAWLIYYERPNRSESCYSQYQLSRIVDPLPMKELLTAALGVEVIVTKQREVWLFENTRIHLDTVADLGEFVELETVFRGRTEASVIDEHEHVKNRLHLGGTDPVAVSYSDLVIQKIVTDCKK